MKTELLLGARVVVCNKELNKFTTGIITTIKDEACYVQFREISNKIKSTICNSRRLIYCIYCF